MRKILYAILSFAILLTTSDGYSHPVDSNTRSDHTIATKTSSRRSFLAPSLIIPLSFLANPSKVDALKPKNEALCGTGFFEHIYEFKCTAIGDIEDEGKTKEMSTSEMGISDNLMGKLSLSHNNNLREYETENFTTDDKLSSKIINENKSTKK